MKQLLISDATLRTQCEVLKNAFSFREKLKIAKLLEKAGVDAIELPALSVSKEDMVMCRTIANEVECKVCISAGDNAASLQESWNCIQSAALPCIQVILPISTVQMEYGYHLKSQKMLEKISDLCSAASTLCPNVEFIARDASRAENGFAAACCAAACQNGADTVTLCDDSGVFFPEEFAAMVREVKSVCNCNVMVQPHNGLNMAAACAVASIKAGADGIKTCSGRNDDLDAASIADILRERGDSLGVFSNLDVTAISSILSKVSTPNVSESETIEIQGNDELSLDSSCTLADLSAAAESLGYELSEEDIGNVYREFNRVSQRKSVIGCRELEAIIATSAMQVPSTFHLTSYVVNSGNIITATAHVTLEKDGKSFSGVSTGDGPIDASFHAIEQIIGHHYELDDFQIQAVTKGREAVGSSLIRLRTDGKLYSGNGISTDIVGACIRAYINALNKIIYEGK